MHNLPEIKGMHIKKIIKYWYFYLFDSKGE